MSLATSSILAAQAGLFASYWGKADPAVAERTGAAHHTVLGHSLDVAAVAFVLVEVHPVLRHAFASDAGIDVARAASTIAVICALHDVGKLDTRFQRKAPAVADRLRPESAGVSVKPYHHGIEGFRQLEDDEAVTASLSDGLGHGALALLRAVTGHHGELPTRAEPQPDRAELPPKLRRQDARARALFVDGILQLGAELDARLPWPTEVTGVAVQRLGGLCAVADWVGSNVDYFPYSPEPVLDARAYFLAAVERARVACAETGLLRSSPVAVSFRTLFPFPPRDVQCLTEQVAVDEPALVVVEAEMGRGKTEAALSLASRFLQAAHADGVVISLPTMATSNAMFRRVEAIASKLFGGDVQLALAHSRAQQQPLFEALVRRAAAQRDQEAAEATVSCARWLLQRKRILLAQIGVGTIDQALQAGLVVPHQFVRMFGLSRDVVIIDEVHAYDAYMEVLLEHLVSWLGAFRVPVILLSATLPIERRLALARAWRGGTDEQPIPDAASAGAASYPMVSVSTARSTTTHCLLEEVPDRPVQIELSTQPEIEVASRLIQAAQAGARVVWIRNTVREAQRAYAAVSARAGAVEHRLFHARFRSCDRARLEASVLDQFGKECPAGGRVLIATQVVEQSLDLDFDELHTDLCPIDLLFQRAGRLHRHERDRLPGFSTPKLVVHVPMANDVEALRFGPSRYVYDVGTLWLAYRTLSGRASVKLPSEIRPLVEATYHPAARAAGLAMGGTKLVEAEARRAQELLAKQTKARRCCTSPSTADPDGLTPLKDDDEDAVQAFTRDGQSATLLPLLWDGVSGRSLEPSPVRGAWEIEPGKADAWRLARALVDETLSIPARADVRGEVASGNLAAWTAWESKFRRFADESGLGRRVQPLPLEPFGDAYRGWLRMGGKRRRVVYSPTHGLLMPSEKDEVEAR